MYNIVIIYYIYITHYIIYLSIMYLKVAERVHLKCSHHKKHSNYVTR